MQLMKYFHRQEEHDESDLIASRTLGVVSIAIGLTELLFPKKLEKAMGIHNGENTGVLRTLGVREITHGIDLLSHKDPTPGVWSRVAGDMLDGALLTMAAKKSRNPKGMIGIFALVAPVVIADMILAPKLSVNKMRR